MNKKILSLRSLTEAERDAKVNIAMAEIAGWTDCETISSRTGVRVTGGCPPDGNGGFPWLALPPYATSADAVLLLLEKWDSRAHPKRDWHYYSNSKSMFLFQSGAVHAHGSDAPTFPLAACYSLLRANGYEVLT